MKQIQVDVLRRGAAEWNRWRVENDITVPDFAGADLHGLSLSGADLRAANFKGADLRDANLRAVNLRAADLRGADLRGAILWSASLTGADLRAADLTGADLRAANLRAADLKEATLTGADLGEANLRTADLVNAILLDVKTNDFTDFRGATITGAQLWKNEKPVEDWQADTTGLVDTHTVRARITVRSGEYVCAQDLSAVLQMLDAALYEYERRFLSSLSGAIGETLIAACLHKLQADRNQIVRVTKFDTGGFGMEAVFIPMSIMILSATACREIEDVWKRAKVCSDIKKYLAIRADDGFGQLQEILQNAMKEGAALRHYDLSIKAILRETQEVSELILELTPRAAGR